MGIEAKTTDPIKKLAKLAVIVAGVYLGATFAPALFPASSTASYYGAAAGGALTGYAASQVK